jgi:hypothetical protein
MKQQPQLLSVDEAMAEFMHAMSDLYGDSPPAPGTPPSPAEKEADLFDLAERLLHLACPDPGACTDPRCRRDRLCRHFAFVRDKRETGIATHPRRTPSAEAFRYAVWVFMNAAGVR